MVTPGFNCTPLNGATCSICFTPICVQVLVDHDGPSVVKLEERINVAAFVLGQMHVAASCTQQIFCSGVEINVLLPCSFFLHFNLLALMTIVCCGVGAVSVLECVF
jgi:hypothetical protein